VSNTPKMPLTWKQKEYLLSVNKLSKLILQSFNNIINAKDAVNTKGQPGCQYSRDRYVLK
jgi:hypothetical protein